MTPQQEDLSRIIRQAHHLARAEFWWRQTFAAVAIGGPLMLIGLATHDAVLATGCAVLLASWVCSELAVWHVKKAKKAK